MVQTLYLQSSEIGDARDSQFRQLSIPFCSSGTIMWYSIIPYSSVVDKRANCLIKNLTLQSIVASREVLPLLIHQPGRGARYILGKLVAAEELM